MSPSCFSFSVKCCVQALWEKWARGPLRGLTVVTQTAQKQAEALPKRWHEYGQVPHSYSGDTLVFGGVSGRDWVGRMSQELSRQKGTQGAIHVWEDGGWKLGMDMRDFFFFQRGIPMQTDGRRTGGYRQQQSYTCLWEVGKDGFIWESLILEYRSDRMGLVYGYFHFQTCSLHSWKGRMSEGFWAQSCSQTAWSES